MLIKPGTFSKSPVMFGLPAGTRVISVYDNIIELSTSQKVVDDNRQPVAISYKVG